MAPRMRDLPTLPLTLAAALLLVVLLALGACGDGTSGAVWGEDDQVIDQAAVAKMDAAEFRAMMAEASDRLIANHGGDAAAFIALFWGLDRGYDSYQLLTGALNGRLAADGRITDAKGTELTPARPAEGIIRVSGSNGGEIGDGAAGSPDEPVLLACLSGPVAFADDRKPTESPAELELYGRALLIMECYDWFAEVPTRIAQREQEEYEQKRLSEDELKKRQAALSKETVTRIITELAAKGYSTKQLAQAAVLLQTDADWQRVVNAFGWGCRHTSGETLRPAYEPITSGMETIYPPADKDAPTDYDRADVEAALDGMASSSGEATTTTTIAATTTTEAAKTPPEAEDIITSTELETPIPITLRGSDADGDDLTYTYEQPENGVAEGAPPFLTYTPNDGFAGATDMFIYTVSDGKAEAIGTVQIEVEPLRYVGEVGILSQSKLPVYYLDHSYVELVVAGSTVTATMEFTLVAVLKWTSDEYLCTATMHRVYRGEGPRGDNVSLKLELMDSSDFLEGPDQEGVNVPVVQSQVLEGTFSSDGTFTGNIRNVWAIGAARVE